MKRDSQLYNDIMEKLEFEPMIDSSRITIAVHNDIVTLGGVVGSYSEKHAVERAVNNTRGVKAIANELKVDPIENAKRNDADIAAAAINALQWHVMVPDDKIKVTVEKGRITLSGGVEWWFQRKNAEKAVRNLLGVTGVNNHIVVKPTAILASDVKNKITRELERNAEIDAKNIQVDVIGSKVILSGEVRAWAEIQEATRGAWSVPGVTEVVNKLTIAY